MRNTPVPTREMAWFVCLTLSALGYIVISDRIVSYLMVYVTHFSEKLKSGRSAEKEKNARNTIFIHYNVFGFLCFMAEFEFVFQTVLRVTHFNIPRLRLVPGILAFVTLGCKYTLGIHSPALPAEVHSHLKGLR